MVNTSNDCHGVSSGPLPSTVLAVVPDFLRAARSCVWHVVGTSCLEEVLSASGSILFSPVRLVEGTG